MTEPHLAPSPFRQPKAVWAVAFACVVSFMGIGLVDPILPAISEDLHATPSQVTLLFTSYLVVTAVAMLVTGWVSSRIGAKRTLIAGLVLIVIFSALAGASGSMGGIVGFRAGWGLGNALFIATSLAVIVASASGGFAGAIILYETALGLGIAVGPLLGGLLGDLSWRGPVLRRGRADGDRARSPRSSWSPAAQTGAQDVPDRPAQGAAPPRAAHHERHRALLQLGLLHRARLRPVPDGAGRHRARPGVHRLGPARGGLLGVRRPVAAAPVRHRPHALRQPALFAVDVLVIAAFTDSRATLIVAVIVAGVFIGVNNTLTTQAVMTVAPVERPVASAAYGFVRFIGGGLAPFAAGKLAEQFGVHVPFFVGGCAVVLSIAILALGHRNLLEAERNQAAADAHAPAGGHAAQPVGAERD